MHGWMKIQKYTNSKGKYLNKAFNKSINLKEKINYNYVNLSIRNNEFKIIIKKLY